MYTFICFIFLYAQHIYIFIVPGTCSGVFWGCFILSTKVLSKQNTGRSIEPSRGHLSCATFMVMIPEAVPVGPLNRPKHAGSLRSRQETWRSTFRSYIYFNLHHWTCLWETFNNTYLHHYIKCFCSVSVAEIKAKRECFHLQTVVMYVVYGGIRFNLPTKVAVKWWREVALAKRLVSCWMHF